VGIRYDGHHHTAEQQPVHFANMNNHSLRSANDAGNQDFARSASRLIPFVNQSRNCFLIDNSVCTTAPTLLIFLRELIS
jgi:hypothetical protein